MIITRVKLRFGECQEENLENIEAFEGTDIDPDLYKEAAASVVAATAFITPLYCCTDFSHHRHRCTDWSGTGCSHQCQGQPCYSSVAGTAYHLTSSQSICRY
jgi:hypothetical protein